MHSPQHLLGIATTTIPCRYPCSILSHCLPPTHSTPTAPALASPAWLLEETDDTRTGLMKLRHNVVLLKDPTEPDHFYPRFNLMNTTRWGQGVGGWDMRV